MKILIADDNEDSRIILKRTLESAGYEVLTASNGKEALNIAKKSPPDMIISDILMPQLDGFGFCREIKQDEKLKKTPFVFYTASYTDEGDRRLAMTLGASMFIVKPIDPEEFSRIINKIIKEHEEHRLNVPEMTIDNASELSRMHAERLAKKLDQKIEELETGRIAFRQKEAELWASEEKYRKLIETANDAIFVADAETGIIIDANNQAEKLLGIPIQKIIGMHQVQLHPGEEAEKYRKVFQEHIQNKHSISENLFVVNHYGQKIPVEISASVTEIGGKKIVQGIFRDLTERTKVVEALQESEDRFRTIFENSPIGISIADSESRIIQSNPAFQKMLGYSEDELCRSFAEVTHPDDVAENLRLFKEMVDGKRGLYRMEKRYIRKDGSVLWANLTVTAVRDQEGRFKYNFAMVEDLSERKRLEDQLRHAQKMEAVGQLAGGIAHDFNNLLTAIIGYGNILKMKLKNDDQLIHNINQILAITERGATLIHGLLAFSRKQIIALKPVRLNELVERMEKLLPRLIGEEIELKVRLANEDLTIMADSSQIEQILVNLAANARDAMPGGGILSIETERAVLDRESVEAHGYGIPGIYALISVSDTGYGMDNATKGKIFEPFFTTKGVGEGTGLGLAMVYGIIKQHNGYINVYSEVGEGTTFKLYFPIVQQRIEKTEQTVLASDFRGTETILLAEDETEVRGALKSALEEFGFTIIEATDGEDAVKKFTENKNNIHLLILDVVMPKKNGKEVYEEIKGIRPDIKAIFTSGYTEKTIHARGVLEEGLNFISKPFSPLEISRKIREVLDV